MITRGMSYEEIVEEFKKDDNSSHFISWWSRLNKNKNYYRHILKHARDKMHIFRPIQYKSPRGNDYMMIPQSFGLSHYKKYGLSIHNYLYYRIDGSDYYVMSPTDMVRGFSENLSIHNEGYTFYTPHFFDRYQERCLGGTRMPRLDLIHKFITDNFNQSLITSSEDLDLLNDNYPNSYYSYCASGIILGSFLNPSRSIVLASTIITQDMLKGDQDKKLEAMKRGYEEVKDSIKYPIIPLF